MSLDALCGDKLNDLKAGGIATTGTKRILDIVPKSIHERCPVFLGSKDDVQDLMKFYKEVAEE
jgi:fructose-1,6-bisphosphatase I